MTTPAQNTVNSGTKSDESDKLETKFGTGKDFDALVSTLKMAIERGDIDKENVHRMAHGLGIKPETLAQMVGAPSKENIEAKDQDESPEPEVAPPDVQKNFKDFRDETAKATNVTEGKQLSSKEQAELRNSMRRAGSDSAAIRAEIQRRNRLGRGSGRLAKDAQVEIDRNTEMLNDRRVQAAMRQAAASARRAAARRAGNRR